MPVLLGSFSTWLLPFWLVTLGVVLGWILLAAAFGLLMLGAQVWPEMRRVTAGLPSFLQEGFLKPLLIVAAVLAGVAVLATLLDVADVVNLRKSQVMRSLLRLPFAHNVYKAIDLPAAPADSLDGITQPLELSFDAVELQELQFESDQDLDIRIPKEYTATEGVTLHLAIDPLSSKKDAADQKRTWTWRKAGRIGNPFVGDVQRVDVVNRQTMAAHLTVDAKINAEIPEVLIIPQTALWFVGLVLGYFLFRTLAPKASAIAAATCKEGLSQPLFYLLLCVGLFVLFIYVIVPQNTFGEDIKLYKDAGVTLIRVMALVVAMWTASVSVADEIEGRTAVMVLSKPVSRRQFVIGKFLGVIQPVAIMFIVQGAFLLAATSFKHVYEARETARPEPPWVDCYREMTTVLPGLALAFMEVVVFASISVAVSTRLPMLPNLLIGFTMYALGHLVPLLVQNKEIAALPLVAFVGRLLATIVPVVDHFDVGAAFTSDHAVPVEYLLLALLFCCLYSTVAMLVGLFLFEDRDVA